MCVVQGYALCMRMSPLTVISSEGAPLAVGSSARSLPVTRPLPHAMYAISTTRPCFPTSYLTPEVTHLRWAFPSEREKGHTLHAKLAEPRREMMPGRQIYVRFV